jgi:hypothetical protein
MSFLISKQAPFEPLTTITISGDNSSFTRIRRRVGLAPLALASAVVLGCTVHVRSEKQPTGIPFADIGAKVTADYKGEALGITAISEGALLRCEFQKLEGHATPEGLWLASTEPGTEGKLCLRAIAVGRAERETQNLGPLLSPCGNRGNEAWFPELSDLESSSPETAVLLDLTGAVAVSNQTVRFTRPRVTEEYSVSVDGVRQDFLIAERPDGAGELRVDLVLNGARARAAAYGARLTLEGSRRGLAYGRLRVEDATGQELTARLEVLSAERLAVSVADANATYPVRIDPTFSDADWVSLNRNFQ